MTALDIFTYAGQQVRTVIVDGEAWFVARDVTAALGLSNGRDAISRLDSDGVGNADIIDSMGRTQTAATVNESGLYELIFQSRVAGAVTFKRWVTHEVLPSIRKTGQFGSALPTNFAEALELAALKVREIEALEAKAAEDAPKLEAYGRLMDSDGHYSFEAVGKMIGVGRNTLFRRLREAGIIQTGSRLPYQRYAHHFDVVATTWRDAEGTEHPTFTTKILPSGLPFILKKIGAKALMPAATTG
jgi:anti-repressor protein